MLVLLGPYPNYNKTTGTTPPRKVKIEVDKFDHWNADHTIALIVHPILEALQKNKVGSGLVDDEDVPDELKSTSAPPCESWETDENFFKRWDYALGEMIFAFGEIARHNATEEVDENGEFVRFRNSEDPHFQRVQNGLRLFAKYYFNLWD